MNAEDSGSADEQGDGDTNERSGDQQGIYRPPRVAAMPYTGGPRDKKSRRQPVPSALDALTRQDPYQPHVESTSGLGSAPSMSSNRAREIQRMTEFEEENFTRIVMKKKDMKRRRRDEEDIALGGSGGLAGIRRGGGGLEAELGDVLRSVGRSRSGVVGDGYEELRKKGRRGNVLDRSRTRTRDEAFENMGDDAPRLTKRSRFEKAAKAAKKKLLKTRK
jgi:U3 small nucleolar ribonucleoprotein protein LCP5